MSLWPPPVRRLSSFFVSPGAGGGAIDDTAFSKLEKASLKFVSWAPAVQNWMGMDVWTGKDEGM